MRSAPLPLCLCVVTLTLHNDAHAQVGAGAMTLKEGSPRPKLRSGMVGDIAEDGCPLGQYAGQIVGRNSPPGGCSACSKRTIRTRS